LSASTRSTAAPLRAPTPPGLPDPLTDWFETVHRTLEAHGLVHDQVDTVFQVLVWAGVGIEAQWQVPARPFELGRRPLD
jgi:hypothetical protein